MAEQDVLADRVAVVTGAASGMGRVMARALAGAGARIAAVDVDAAGLDRLAAEPAFAGKFRKIVADVSRTAACRGAVREVIDAFGALDILINCAGVSMSAAALASEASGQRGNSIVRAHSASEDARKRADDTRPEPGSSAHAAHQEARIKFYEADPDGWQRILTINCIGAFLMTRFAVAPMIERGWGRIINVTTSFDTMLAAGLSAYGASKAALEASCVTWSKDLEGTGVTVNILVPGGPTDTPGFFPPGKPRPPVLLDPQIMSVPVAWLASPQSDGISACRFIARDWDQSLPPAEAAARVRTPAAWPALAQGASSARGHAM